MSVVILTKNEERNLPACLDSVAFSDDIVVFDSYSDDATVEIAEARPNVRVVQRRFDNWSAHQNWGVQNIPFRHPWVLYIDADERVDDELAVEVQRAADPASPLSAFRFRRKDLFMGRWLRHAQLYPTWLIRLFRPERVRYERLVNPVTVVDGPVGELHGHIVHYPFSKGVHHWIERHNSYATFEAMELLRIEERVRRPLVQIFSRDANTRRAAQKDLFFRMPCRPQIKWLYYMLGRWAFLDGRPGCTYARLTYLYEYMISIKAAELRARNAETARSDLRPAAPTLPRASPHAAQPAPDDEPAPTPIPAPEPARGTAS